MTGLSKSDVEAIASAIARRLRETPLQSASHPTSSRKAASLAGDRLASAVARRVLPGEGRDASRAVELLASRVAQILMSSQSCGKTALASAVAERLSSRRGVDRMASKISSKLASAIADRLVSYKDTIESVVTRMASAVASRINRGLVASQDTQELQAKTEVLENE